MRGVVASRSRWRGSTSSSRASCCEGALAGLHAHGVAEEDVDVVWVPGAFELPLVARRLAGSRTFDAVICLGAVIRGETAHFELVAGEAAAGIREAAEATGVPVTFGVLTTETLEQALDRAGGKHGNKGWDAATAAIEMASLLEQLPKEAEAVIVDKPWGKVVTYALNQPSSVRVITVEPGQETSVHYHQMRDEMWVVLDAGLSRADRQPAGGGVARGRSSW